MKLRTHYPCAPELLYYFYQAFRWCVFTLRKLKLSFLYFKRQLKLNLNSNISDRPFLFTISLFICDILRLIINLISHFCPFPMHITAFRRPCIEADRLCSCQSQYWNCVWEFKNRMMVEVWLLCVYITIVKTQMMRRLMVSYPMLTRYVDQPLPS